MKNEDFILLSEHVSKPIERVGQYIQCIYQDYGNEEYRKDFMKKGMEMKLNENLSDKAKYELITSCLEDHYSAVLVLLMHMLQPSVSVLNDAVNDMRYSFSKESLQTVVAFSEAGWDINSSISHGWTILQYWTYNYKYHGCKSREDLKALVRAGANPYPVGENMSFIIEKNVDQQLFNELLQEWIPTPDVKVAERN